MKKTIIALLAITLVIYGQAAAYALDKSEVEKIIEEYINNHPEVIENSLRKHMERQREQARQAELERSFQDTKDVDPSGSPSMGNDSAPVTIVEFSDFECPYCARAVVTLKQLTKKYGDKVRVVYKHYPIENHAKAWPAALASMAAHEQGKFWEFHDMLMFKQNEWRAVEDPVKIFIRYAESLGLDKDKFKQALSNKNLREAVQKDMEQAKKLQVQATPTFFVNGVMVRGAVDIDYFSKVVDRLLAENPL